MEHRREGTSTEEAANFDSDSRVRTGRVETLSLLRADQGLFLRRRVHPMNRVDASRMGLDLCQGRPAMCGAGLAGCAGIGANALRSGLDDARPVAASLTSIRKPSGSLQHGRG